MLQRVVCPADLLVSQLVSFATRALIPIKLIRLVSLLVFLVICTHIALIAILALVDSAILHLRVFIKISEGLFGPTLKACFYRGCHAST
jgi:hypothetical protein